MNLSHSEPWPSLGPVRLLAGGTKVESPGATFGPRTQFSWEFVWVREGSLRAMIDHTAISGNPGSVLLVPPRAVDQYDWGARASSRHSFLHFDFAFPKAPWPTREAWPLVRHFPAEHAFFPLFDYLLELAILAPPSSGALVGPCLDLLLRMFLVESPAVFEAPLVLPRAVDLCLSTIRERLEANPEAHFTLGELARVASLSPQHLCRLFRRTLSVGPMECVRLVRLEQSLTLLERTDLQVQEVSRRCGFANAFHYSRAFSSAFDRSPTQYRAAFRQGQIPRGVSPAFRALKRQPMVVDEPAVSHYIRATQNG